MQPVNWRNSCSVLFAWLISHTFLANEQYFSLTINQPTVLSAITYQPNEQGIHLFLACPFSEACWATLGLIIHQPSDPFGTLESFRHQLHQPFFMEIIVAMSWSIWTVRNDAIFRHVQPTVQNYKVIFRREFAQVILREKSRLAPLLTQWLEAYV